MEKFCQSCGMPLAGHQGTEADGTVSLMYCEYCYQDGKFTQPDITFEEMKQTGLEGIEQGEGNSFKKFLLKKSYPMQLKGLKRWKS